MMKYEMFRILPFVIALVILGGCSNVKEPITYVQITAEEAKEIMDSSTDYVLLDVRTQEEYDESHIPCAVLLPDYEIMEKAGEQLPDQDQWILVYCRSGRRSKLAADALAKLGYTNVKEFGGIIDWPYEIE